MNNEENINRAIEHLNLHAMAQSIIPETVSKYKSMPKLDLNDADNREERARVEVTFALLLFTEGRITKAEYLYHRAMPLISFVFESRWQDGACNTELEPLRLEMRKIEKQHCLSEEEFWMRGEGPEEYEELNRKYENVLDKKQGEVFREFGQDDLAELWESNRQEFDECFEKGRVAIFETKDTSKVLKELAEEYEREADICQKAKVFYAACALLGAAMEARLLQTCISKQDEACVAINKLPSEKRPKSKNPLNWSLVHLLRICSAAGWLPPHEGEVATHAPEGWGHRLRELRNLLHPGKHVQDRPRTVIGEEELEDARAIFTLVVLQLQSSMD